MRGLLRGGGNRHQPVTTVELFFDLVYVFAITQLSHLLLDHLTIHGALQTLLLLLAVWWAWTYTTWFANWFNPDRRAVRLTLFGVMLASLLMSSSLPEAFGERGLLFAGAYVTMQVGRSLFIIAASAEDPGLRRNFQRIICWAAAAGLFWVLGGFAEDSRREILWIVAVIIDCSGPAAGYVVPGLGRSTTHDWMISGSHMAERCQLFLMIALGESILVMGVTFADLEHTTSVILALVFAFCGSVAFWWLYFDQSAEAAGERIAADADPGRIARSAYTYAHLPLVAGIIVAAVGDELVIHHPTGHADEAIVATVVGSTALFIFGHLLFKRAAFGVFSQPRLIALPALALLALGGKERSPIVLSALSTAVVVAVILWDTRVAHVRQTATHDARRS